MNKLDQKDIKDIRKCQVLLIKKKMTMKRLDTEVILIEVMSILFKWECELHINHFQIII